ncbi:MAG: urease accessory protein UreE [Endozoicomonas sp.]
MLQLVERLSSSEERMVDDQLQLPFDERKRGRLRAVTVKGAEVGIFIERGDVMRDGTLLRAESGEVVQVLASPEEVSTARCHDTLTFARACYHLGNRHVPLQVGDNWLRYQRDHVLDEMVELLGLAVTHEAAPFEPENGAYSGSGHSHAHTQEHGHHHEH